MGLVSKKLNRLMEIQLYPSILAKWELSLSANELEIEWGHEKDRPEGFRIWSLCSDFVGAYFSTPELQRTGLA